MLLSPRMTHYPSVVTGPAKTAGPTSHRDRDAPTTGRVSHVPNGPVLVLFNEASRV